MSHEAGVDPCTCEKPWCEAHGEIPMSSAEVASLTNLIRLRNLADRNERKLSKLLGKAFDLNDEYAKLVEDLRDQLHYERKSPLMKLFTKNPEYSPKYSNARNRAKNHNA